MKTTKELRELVVARKVRSAWKRGVKEYALELIDNLDDEGTKEVEVYGSPADMKTLLNGADNWHQYSEAGCSLIEDSGIAERLCTPSELKRNRNGDLNPNIYETWLDVQARALHQAAGLVMRLARY